MNPRNISKRIGPLVNRFLAPLGFQIRRMREPEYLRDFGIATVLDVGANTGQFAGKMRRIFPYAAIHSFEPIADAFATLTRKTRQDSRLFPHQIALGDTDGQCVMHQNASTPSSSVLPMAASHIRAFPFTAQSEPIEIAMMRLDAWASTRSLEAPLLIKLDVQGFEDRVIAGGLDVIGGASVLVLEMSFDELYCGQVLFDDLHSRVRALGFRCIGIDELVIDPNSGKTLQADVVFASTSLASSARFKNIDVVAAPVGGSELPSTGTNPCM